MLYHYTIGHHLSKIMQSGSLLPIPLGNEFEGERVAVWLSSNDHWEPTAQKAVTNQGTGEMILLGMEGTAKLCGGLFRFIVSRKNPKIIGFNKYATTSNVPAWLIAFLKTNGSKQGGHYYQWFASYEPITRGEWLGVEEWRKGKWVPID